MNRELTAELATKIQQCFATVELKSLDNNGNGTFRVVASDETVDRAGEIIKVNGWDLENYMKNPIILFGHDYWNIENIVGRATRVYVENSQLIVEGVFSGTESGQLCRQLYDEKILVTVSVGFMVRGRDGTDPNIITKAELYELSFVPIPANPNALSLDKQLVSKAFEAGILVKEENQEPEPENQDPEEIVGDTPETEEKEVIKLLKEISTKLDNMPEVFKSFLTKSATMPDDNGEDLEAAKLSLQALQKNLSAALYAVKGVLNKE